MRIVKIGNDNETTGRGVRVKRQGRHWPSGIRRRRGKGTWGIVEMMNANANEVMVVE